MPRPMILAFNLSEQRLARLRFLCMKLGTLVQPVPAEDGSQPLSALCGLTDRVDAPAAEPFAEEMIVFCHMNNQQVNRFLQTARQQRIPAFPLKAMLTPTNAAWTPAQLCAELKQEREAIERGGKAHQPESVDQPSESE